MEGMKQTAPLAAMLATSINNYKHISNYQLCTFNSKHTMEENLIVRPGQTHPTTPAPKFLRSSGHREHLTQSKLELNRRLEQVMASDIFPANYRKSSRSMSSPSGNCTPRNSTFQLTARGSLCLNERLGVLYRHTGARPHDSVARPDRSHLVWKMPALPPQVGVMCNLNHPKL